MWQDRLHALEADMARVQSDNDRLRSEVRAREASSLAGGYDDKVATRMGELESLLNELEGPVGDIERFDVDGGYVFMIQDKVLFSSGSAAIGEDGRKALAQLAKTIQGQSHGRIFVRGHTDSDPVKKPETLKRFPLGNLQLSAERAVAVGALLTEHSIPERDVVVVGFGEWERVAPNDSPDNKRLNRRVEIFVADPSTK
jgi:chemotaxis protein MotB